MVTVEQFEDDNCLLKYAAVSEPSKSNHRQLQVVKLPLYRFGNQSAVENGAFGVLPCSAAEDHSFLDSLLLALWEDRAWKGILRYDVTTCETKVVSGRKNYVIQFNKDWDLSHHAEIEEKVFQSMESRTLACMNGQREETLFTAAHGDKANHELIHSDIMPTDASLTFVINANPLEYGHVFLVPRGFNDLPQILDARILEMVTTVAVDINNCSFHLFCDSSSSAPNLYFQACYFANPLPVELVPVMTVLGNWQRKRIHIHEFADYPIKGLSFKSNGNLKLLVEVVAKICFCLQNENTPYSLLISDCGTKMFLFPQVHTSAANRTFSAIECGGHFVFKDKKEFALATEQVLTKRLSAASLNNEAFEALKQLCCSVASKLAS